MHYRLLKNKEANLKHLDFSLVSLRKEDIQLVRKWRNEQMDVLRQKKEISEEAQIAYFDSHVQKSFGESEPEIMLFSFLKSDECIGYGGLVHMDWTALRAEVSFLLNTQDTKHIPIHQFYFRSFLKLLTQLAFHHLHLNRLYTEVYAIRPWHVDVLEEEGFQFEGRLKEHVNIAGQWVDSLLHGLLRKNWQSG